ncbi:MAG: hypothetical protein HYY49_00365 [Ignavibacteriales bacterium]|nr:hypothetical protein [Ignavibacteriales bacterium]
MKTFLSISLFCFLAAATLATTSFAQKVKGVQIVKAELVSDATDFSKPFIVGIKFVIEPEWNLYWKNPGDSGLPIDVTWVLPRGWEADDLLHPVPQKFAYENVVSYGYKKEVVLLTTITPKGNSGGTVRANLDWLVCEKSCVKGSAKVRFDVKWQTAKQREEAARLLAMWRGRLPQTRQQIPVVFQKASASFHGAGLSIEIPFEATRRVNLVDFFPSSVKGIFIDYSSVGVRDGKIVFNATLEGTGTGDIYLSGLLIDADGSAYECSVPVKFSTM